jgi:F0F1-type ATP synthase membrane subunit b/b'
MLASESIRLMPDWTVTVQLLIFVSVMTALTFLVIRPTIRIIDRRKQFTSDAAEEAEKLFAEAEQLRAGRREALAMSLKDAHAEYEKRTAEARKSADAITEAARAKVADILRGEAKSIASSEVVGDKDLDARVKEISREIVARVGKDL